MKIGLILMAAGSGKRFGGHKLLAKIKCKPIYEYVIDACVGIEFAKKIIVTGEKSIIDYAEKLDFNVVINTQPHLGQAYSITLGMREVLDTDAVMFLVCDQPFISKTTIKKMMDEYKENTILIAKYNDRLGNPNIFSKKFYNELLSLEGDVGGKEVIKKNMDSLKYYSLNNEKELMDIDTKTELKRIEEL